MPDSSPSMAKLRTATRGVHAGSEAPTGQGTPTVPPIHTATAYTYANTTELDAVFEDNSRGYVYSRYGSPTVRALETAMAAVEGTEDAVAFASGMAALHGVIAALVTSDAGVVASRDVYGATWSLLRNVFAPQGINVTFVDMRDLESVDSIVAESKPAIVLAETISNPLIRVADVAAIATIAHKSGAFFALDNTFASPTVVNGSSLGADAVIHSSTKHLGGHGDTTGGIVATDETFARKLREQNKLVGNVLSPFDAWLTLRGLRTLDIRVRKQCANAVELVAWLQASDRVSNVNYPGLNAPVPDGQFEDGLLGTMLSFEIADGDRATVFALFDALKLIKPATTLGDVSSLCLHPATSSHRALSGEERAEIGIADSLVRISIGIEDIQDVIADLDQAFHAIAT